MGLKLYISAALSALGSGSFFAWASNASSFTLFIVFYLLLFHLGMMFYCLFHIKFDKKKTGIAKELTRLAGAKSVVFAGVALGLFFPVFCMMLICYGPIALLEKITS